MVMKMDILEKKTCLLYYVDFISGKLFVYT